ncbi:hypothetical protein BpHYR1_007359 [Brachionus plicatilis]|uniref:Uncharacterized protein n=1 Tax=Brachionus plicatilis TaxID=10195 RepID=A0A3M7PCF7_BRAPC|nr:hypothetical protein BpHYR1_007359 [Brachionus plicatilis]
MLRRAERPRLLTLTTPHNTTSVFKKVMKNSEIFGVRYLGSTSTCIYSFPIKRKKKVLRKKFQHSLFCRLTSNLKDIIESIFRSSLKKKYLLAWFIGLILLIFN